MSFLAGSSEMAERTRDFNWSTHPFGPPEIWPQSLRAALGICLTSAFPTAIYWGPELRLLYNDAWSSIPGPRHPAALGAPAREVWADIWHVIEPQFRKVFATGEGLFVEDQMLPMRRYGFEEETYWNYSFTPIRGEDGAVAGIFNSGSETTERVLQRRRAEFLLTLSDGLRQSSDETRTLATTIRELGTFLRAARVALMSRTGERGSAFAAVDQWTDGVFGAFDREVDVDHLGDPGAALLEGRVVRLDSGTSEPGAEALLCGASAALLIPWMHDGRLESVLAIHSTRPRRWTAVEVATAEDTLNRGQTWAEQQRALSREKVMLREIDHRARNLLSVVRSILRLTRADDAESLRDKVSDRILALSRTHTLLARKRWHEVTLEDLITQELEPYGAPEGERIAVSGPSVILSSERAQSVAMVLHELVTNAAKHGALSGLGGTLDVAWEKLPGGVVGIDWHERVDLSEAPSAPERGTGFGSTLLPLVVEGQLGGTLTRDFADTGLVCRITFPAAEPVE